MSELRHHSTEDHEPMPEGEEAAPPLVKTMAVIRWLILGGMTLFAVIMLAGYVGLGCGSGDKSEATQYHCPMHPTYVASQPGECPICGMSLVPVDKSDTTPIPDTSRHATYTCPMHPEVVSDQPGTCPQCGMDLEEAAGAQPGQYTCPMHPEVISDEPGRCPKCNMFLEQVPMSADSGHADHGDMGSAPVAGLVPVTIESQRLQLIGLRTGTVATRSLDGSLRLVGFVTPDETRLENVHVRFSGWVKQLLVDQTGQTVGANDRLLSVYSQDLYQAEQDYLVARQSALRTSSDPTLQESRRQLLEAAGKRLQLLGVPPEELARLDSEGTATSELWIRSPFSGYVLEKNVVNGQFIGPDQNLFTLADLSLVWVVADVYQRDAAKIKIGAKARMTSSALPGEFFSGTIAFVYPTVSQETRTLKVRLEFPNPDQRLLPGTYVEVDLGGDGKGVLAVPADAVMDGGTEQYAFVVHGRTHFEPRRLSLGQRSDDWLEVLSGLSEGDVVVTSANFLIDSESRLKAAIAGMGSISADSHAAHPN